MFVSLEHSAETGGDELLHGCLELLSDRGDSPPVVSQIADGNLTLHREVVHQCYQTHLGRELQHTLRSQQILLRNYPQITLIASSSKLLVSSAILLAASIPEWIPAPTSLSSLFSQTSVPSANSTGLRRDTISPSVLQAATAAITSCASGPPRPPPCKDPMSIADTE